MMGFRMIGSGPMRPAERKPLKSFALLVDLGVASFVLVRVTLWIVPVFLDKRNDPRNHTN